MASLTTATTTTTAPTTYSNTSKEVGVENENLFLHKQIIEQFQQELKNSNECHDDHYTIYFNQTLKSINTKLWRLLGVHLIPPEYTSVTYTLARSLVTDIPTLESCYGSGCALQNYNKVGLDVFWKMFSEYNDTVKHLDETIEGRRANYLREGDTKSLLACANTKCLYSCLKWHKEEEYIYRCDTGCWIKVREAEE